MKNSESIEQQALQALHQITTPELIERLGTTEKFINESYISCARHLPPSAIVINRSFGLLENLSEIVDFYKEQDSKRFFIHMFDAIDEKVLEALSIKEARAWQKFSLNRKQMRTAINDLLIKKLPPEANATFGKIVCDGFDLGDISVPWLARLPLANNWHCFAVFIEGKMAGVGSLFIMGKYGWLDFGATAPEFRKRGCQSAVLNARIEYAFNQGCEEVFTCTGVDVEGDPQHSYKNIIKAGFKTSYTKRNFAPN